MIATLVSLFVAVLPTPDFCITYRAGYTAAICQGKGAACIRAPREYPACPSEGGTPREGYDRGFDDGVAARTLTKNP